MLHIPPTNLLLTAKQEPYKKSLSLNKKYWRIFWKKFRGKGKQAEKERTERVTGLGRRTRKEIAKWNQTTALRFQTGGRHQTSPASLRGSLYKEVGSPKESDKTTLVQIWNCELFQTGRTDVKHPMKHPRPPDHCPPSTQPLSQHISLLFCCNYFLLLW